MKREDMSFVDHLEELRWHVIRSAISLFVFSIAAFLAKDFIFNTIILAPSRTDFWTYRMLCMMGDHLCIEKLNFSLQNRTLGGQFTMHITSSFIIGAVLAFPYTFWEIWRFVKPGLYPKEKQAATGIVFFVSLLFILGVLFGYFFVTPMSVNFLSNYTLDDSIVNNFDISSYISTLSMLVLGCGLMFQLPIAVLLLSKAGLLTPGFMRNYRRHALIVIVIVGAIITPPDVISCIILSMPLYMLYEASIFISAAVHKERIKRLDLQTS